MNLEEDTNKHGSLLYAAQIFCFIYSRFDSPCVQAALIRIIPRSEARHSLQVLLKFVSSSCGLVFLAIPPRIQILLVSVRIRLSFVGVSRALHIF